MSRSVWELFISAPVELKARKGSGRLYRSPKFINSNHRSFYLNRSEKTREWRGLALTTARARRFPTAIVGRVFIEAWVHPESERSYDAQNLYPTAKAIVDGLVDHGLVPDDNNRHVVGPLCLPGKKGPRAGIMIRVHSLAEGELYPSHYQPYEGRIESLT